METIVKLNRWANAHTNFGIDVLRVLLGAFLFYKGLFLFSSGSGEVFKMMDAMPGPGANLMLIHYIAMSHICGGIFIALGLLTRLSILVQLPILIAAVVINVMAATDVWGLVQASLALTFSVFFLIYGSGKHSVDYGLKMRM
jgi:putative oxidoreductase